MRALRRLVVTAVVVVVVAGVAFAAWDRWWRSAGPENPGFDCEAIVQARHRLPFAAAGVRRVALIGDSIMMQAQCSVAYSLRDVGIETSLHAFYGTGLLTGLDWVAATKKILQTQHPDVVVAVFVGNYLPPPARDANGTVIDADTPAFYRAWQRRAEQLSAVVRAAGAEMYWVSPPPIEVPPLDHADRLFDGYRTIRDDHFLLAGGSLAGPNGEVLMEKETCGSRRAIRSEDRVHLTDDGARIYGQQIARDLTSDLGILATPRPC